QDGVAGAVGRSTGPVRNTLAEARGHAAEGPLIDLPLRRAREGHAVMLQFAHGRDRFTHHVFDGVLIAQPVRPLDGVVHMPAPIVLAHIAECGAHPALRGHGVAASRVDLGNTSGPKTLVGKAKNGAQSRAAAANHHHVISVVDDLVGHPVDGGGLRRRVHQAAPSMSRSTASEPASANNRASSLTAINNAILAPSLWT